MSLEERNFLKPDLKFEWTEYIIFGVVLASSLGIGIFYGFFEKKNKTNEDFLMGGRNMGIFPVTLSLICTFISAVTILGSPVEIYFYGTQFMMIIFAYPIMTVILSYLYVPAYTNLKLVSAFEYLEWRFGKSVRILASIASLINLVIYLPITVYGPSLAFDQVAGVNKYYISAIIFIVCIIYSSMGGLKAVLWTDALQGIVMLVALLAILVAGLIELGGFGVIWQKNLETGRINFFNLDLDPRTRHTFWTSVVGGVAVWLPPFGASQAQIQRYNSLPNLSAARKALFFNMIGLMVIVLLSLWNGMMMFAYYSGCDPVLAKVVQSPDQIIPLFVIEVLGKYPGIPGLLFGGLACGSLSTISSGLNAMTASILEDFVKGIWPDISEKKVGILSRVISALVGLFAFFIVFLIDAVNKSFHISALSITLGGSISAPIFGAFTLGLFFPWANEKGTLGGMISGISAGIYLGLGSVLAGKTVGKLPNQKLPLSIQDCMLSNMTLINNSSSLIRNSTNILLNNSWKNREYSLEVKIWSLSYAWISGITIGITIIFGILFSLLFNSMAKKKSNPVKKKLLSEPILCIWQKLFSTEYINKIVDFS